MQTIAHYIIQLLLSRVSPLASGLLTGTDTFGCETVCVGNKAQRAK